MSYHQNHLFIDEPTIKSINKFTVRLYHQLSHSIVAHPPISWFRSPVTFFPVNPNHLHSSELTISPSVHFPEQTTTVSRKPFSFLFTCSSSTSPTTTTTSSTNTFPVTIKFIFIFCLFIFFYLFSSSIYLSHSTFSLSSSSSSSFINHIVPVKRMASDTCKPAFDVDKVCNCFRQYNEDPNTSSLDLYIEAYKELQKFFQCLGTVFSFVTSDVESKINILESYRKDAKYGEEYVTLQSMIEYEAKHDLLKSQDRPSGARTLLRLHRALAFISKFILEVSKLEDTAATSTAARSAYQETLSKFHPWVIKKTASLAMYGLPNREQLIIRAFGGEPGADKDQFTQTMINLAELSETAYNITNKLYEDNNLLDLP